MSTSSADPSSLRGFAAGSASGDAELADQFVRLRRAHEDFVQSLRWGKFEASEAVQALSTFVAQNRLQANQVSLIALLFELAGGRKRVSTMSDAAIRAYLERAGLSGAREHVTYDDPVALGMPGTSGYASDPVNAATGNFVLPEIDLIRAGLILRRVYNSRSDQAGAFGPGWSSWATTSLRARADGAHYRGPDGQVAVFGRLGAGYGRVLGIGAVVEPLASGLAMRWFDGRRWTFNDAGRPLVLDDGPGTVVRLSYDEDGHLTRLTHQRGVAVSFTWTGGRITAAETDAGARIAYRYDEAGVLVRAGEREYAIGPDGRVGRVVDADGVVEVVNTYDDGGRVLSQVTPFGRRVRLTYLPGGVTVVDDEDGGPSNTYVHDPWGRLLTLIDGHGARLSRTYDEWGNCVTVTDRDGGVTTTEWDDRGRPTVRTGPTGVATRYRYDEAGRLTEVATSTGETTRFEYAAGERLPSEMVDPEGGRTRQTVRDGLIERVTDPDGVAVGYEYDEAGQLRRLVDADGNRTVLERDRAGRVTALVRPGGRRDELEYDDGDRLIGWRTASGAARRFEYSAAGRLTATVDPLGARDETRYGAHGDVEEMTDALGRRTSRSYDPCGNLVRLTTAGGAKWDFGYDVVNRLVSTTDPAGSSWLREYGVTGVLTGLVDPAGARVEMSATADGRARTADDGVTTATFEYDAWGRETAQVRADGSVTRFQYDRCGRRTATVDPAGGVTRIAYTPAGRIRAVTSPAGRAETLEYDRCGRPIARTGSNGQRWEISWDAEGRPVAVAEPDGRVQRYGYDADGHLSVAGSQTLTYDAAGRVTTVTTAGGGRRLFEYDPAGRLVAVVDPLGGRTRYRWSEVDTIVETINPLGGVTARRHDEVGRVLEERDPLGRVQRWAYDAAGRMISHADGSGRTRTWTYDRAGRVSEVRPADGEPVQITRDSLGRPIRLIRGALDHHLAWDALGRPVSHRRGPQTVAWRYDADGRRTAVSYPDGTETTYRYGNADGPVAIAHPATGEISIRRDASGRIVAVDAAGLHATWEYAEGGLAGYTVATGGSTSRTELARDDTGRLTTVTVDGRTTRYGYDQAGQLVTAGDTTFGYDTGGRLLWDGVLTLRYDAAGQLVARGDVGYDYDGAGRRIAERSADGSERTFRWDDLGRLAGIDGPEGSVEVTVDLLGDLAEVNGRPMMWDVAAGRSPLWLEGSAVIGAAWPLATASGGTATWLEPDWQGSVGGLRDAWGAPAAGELSLGYRGEVEFGGLTWLRDRVYDPASREFLATDPLPAVPGTAWSANPYHYAGNDPLERLDPTGRRPLSDEEFRKERDSMGQGLAYDLGRAFNGAMNPAGAALDFAIHHPEIALGTTLVVASVVLDATGVGVVAGVPLGAIGAGIMFGAGSTIVEEKLTKGAVNYRDVAVQGVFGGITGGLSRALTPLFAARLGAPVLAKVTEDPEVDKAVQEAAASQVGKLKEFAGGLAEVTAKGVQRALSTPADASIAAGLRIALNPVSAAADFIGKFGGEQLSKAVVGEGELTFENKLKQKVVEKVFEQGVEREVEPYEDFVNHPSVETFEKAARLPIIAPLPFPHGLPGL
jgi:RHS repeat-associated protein